MELTNELCVTNETQHYQKPEDFHDPFSNLPLVMIILCFSLLLTIYDFIPKQYTIWTLCKWIISLVFFYFLLDLLK